MLSFEYGCRAASGGGRSSARETIGRVAGGAIAEKWLKETCAALPCLAVIHVSVFSQRTATERRGNNSKLLEARRKQLNTVEGLLLESHG